MQPEHCLVWDLEISFMLGVVNVALSSQPQAEMMSGLQSSGKLTSF